MTAAIGKWHLTPGQPAGLERAVRPLAHRARVRLLLGLPRRRGGPVRPADHREPEGPWASRRARTASPTTSRTTWPRRRSTGCTACAPSSRRRPGSCTTRPAAATRRTTCRGSGRTSTRASSTQGWDVVREETLARQKELGVVPPDTELPRERRVPEVGLAERDREAPVRAADGDVRRLLRERGLERRPRPRRDRGRWASSTTRVVIWIWGDNGASMEGTLSGTFNEMTTLNGIPLTTEQQMGLLFKHGGLEAWGGELMAPHYSSAWAWASNCPFDWGKQVASHLGGTRNPLVVRYPSAISDPGAVRSHFTHVIDIAPTVLEIAGIPAPTHVDGIEQEPLHGFTFADSLSDANAPERHTQQYFEAVGNRAMYKDGWWLAMRLPRIPWQLDPEVLRGFGPGWDPDADPVELYYLPDDFAQAKNLADGASGEGRGAPQALLGGGRALPGAADPRRALLLLRDRAAHPEGVEVHLPRADRERRGRDDPAHLQPLVHDQRRPRRPGRRRRGRDRRGVRPPRRLRALRPGREAEAPLLDARRARVHPGGRDAAPGRRASASRWSSPPTRPSRRPAAR